MTVSPSAVKSEISPRLKTVPTYAGPVCLAHPVVGAVLEFAVSVTTKGFNIHTVGVILLAVGIAAFIIGLVFVVAGGTRRATMREDIRC